jgi:hypothetical protein
MVAVCSTARMVAVCSTAWVVAVCLTACGTGERTQLERALVGRGRVVLVSEDVDWTRMRPAGTTLLALSSTPNLASALAGKDPAALVAAMTQADVHGLLVDTQLASGSKSLTSRLARFARLPGLQGAYFARGAALFGLDPVRDWSPELRAGLAEVARRLIAGTAPPRLSSFPEPVRRLEPVEVMVLLRNGTQPRLWRSARGSSFARALLTATAVARQRWVERSQALGGTIDKMLPRLSIEVSLLQDDGEIGVRDAAFIDRVVLPVHGVGYEHKGGWHYLLPEATRSGRRRPSRAYAQLFTDDGLPEDSLDNSELRPYRLAVQLIGTSPATADQPEADDGLSEVTAPAQVLGP